ncbi:MAG: NUDIX hydrolase [bacterium]|nr:NUDIX hydrolase [bacterium]
MKDQFIIAAFGIIFDKQNRVLLCHRCDYNLWNLPGGIMEAGESPWECVIREVREETGLDVGIIRLAGIYNKPNKRELVFSFICKIAGGSLTLNEEADRVEYFDIKDIPNNTSQKQIERINDALKEKTMIYKNQRGESSIELMKEGKL